MDADHSRSDRSGESPPTWNRIADPYVRSHRGADAAPNFEVIAMSIIRHSPWNVRNDLQQEFRQAFERFFSPEEGDQSNVVTSQWAPRVDIKEEDKRFV